MNPHCVKILRIRSYSGPHFPELRLNVERRSFCPYLFQMRENAGKIRTRKTSNANSFYAKSDADVTYQTVNLFSFDKCFIYFISDVLHYIP